MATLKKYNLEGKQVGTVSVNDALCDTVINGQMVKEYIVALRANARQWSACVKSRAEVSHTTKKPHAQKGTGGARQGSLVSPQFRGGGRAFGPRPKFDQHVRINKKERRTVIRSLIAEKIRNDKLRVLETTTLDAPKTKTVVNFLEQSGCKGRVLVIGEGTFAAVEHDDKTMKVCVKSNAHKNFIKSMRNIQKTQFSLASNISGYDILLANDVFVTEAALNEITQWLA